MHQTSTPKVKPRFGERQEVVKRAASARSAWAAATSTGAQLAQLAVAGRGLHGAQPRGEARDPEAGARRAQGVRGLAQRRRGRSRRAGCAAARAGCRDRPGASGSTSARPPRLSASSSSSASSSTGAIRRSSSSRRAGSETGLARCPSMPASRQRSTSSAAVSAVSARIGISGSRSRIASAASSPPSTGIRRSSRMASNGVVARGLDRGLAVRDQGRLDAEALELHAEQPAQRGVVLGHEHAARGQRGGDLGRSDGSQLARFQRQLERERRAGAELADDGDVAAHRAGQPARDAEAEAGAGPGARVVARPRLEEALEIARRRCRARCRRR